MMNLVTPKTSIFAGALLLAVIAIAGAWLLMAQVAPAEADDISLVSNTGQTRTTEYGLANGEIYATKFTTGTGGVHIVTGAQIRWRGNYNTNNVTVSINETGTNPGSTLATFKTRRR